MWSPGGTDEVRHERSTTQGRPYELMADPFSDGPRFGVGRHKVGHYQGAMVTGGLAPLRGLTLGYPFGWSLPARASGRRW